MAVRTDAQRSAEPLAEAARSGADALSRDEAERGAAAASDTAQERLAFIADAGEILASSLDYETTLASIARLAVPRIADWCAVDLLDESGQPRLVAVAHVDPERVRFGYRLREEFPVDLQAPRGVGAVLRTGRSEIVAEIPDEMVVEAAGGDPERLEVLRALGFRSYMAVPLREGERVVGAITFVTAESGRRFGRADLRLAEDLARRATLAFASARLYREASEARRAAEDAARRNAQLLGITAGLSTAVTQQEVAQAVVERGVAALAAAAGSVALLSADGRTVEIVAAVGYRSEQLTAYGSLPIDSPLPLAVAVRTGRPQWLAPLEAAIEDHPEIRETLERAYQDGRRALAAIPLQVGGHTIGAIGLSFDESRDLAETDAEFLTALAQQCAQALERARLYEAEHAARQRAERIQSTLRARERQQATVATLGQQALVGGALSALFRAAVDGIARTLDTEFVELLELTPQGKRLRLVAGAGWRRGLVGRAMLDAGPDSQAGYTLHTGGPVIVKDLATETRFHGSRLLLDHGVVSGITVAISAGAGGTWGVLGTHTSRLETFTADDVNFLLAVANVLGAAIQRRRAEEERDRLLEAERAAQGRRDAFIGVMSHELRTPITTIYAGAKFLAREGRGTKREVRREILSDVQSESERLYRLVEDLLVLTKVERGTVEAAGEPLLLQRIVPRVAAAEQAATPGLRVETAVPETLPTVRGEETYVEQALRNLLSNARKYGPPGGSVQLIAEANDDEVVVRVLDEGPGFPAEEGERLFEVFYRSPATAEQASGAGIGLFVCRHLVEAMGGRVWAVPRPEGGAEFGFALPRVPDDEMA